MGPLSVPAPAGPVPRPPASKRWIWVTLLTMVGIGLPTTLVFLRLRDDASSGDSTADRFVHAVITGAGIEDKDGGRTGLRVAYDLLSEKRRDALPFDVFFEDWNRLFDQRGFIVAHRRESDHNAEGHAHDPIKYLLFLGGEEQDHSKLNTVRLDVVLSRRSGDFYVASYTLRDCPNPLATR